MPTLKQICINHCTCTSGATASSPSYIMFTQPSLDDRTNSDMRAWRENTVYIRNIHRISKIIKNCRTLTAVTKQVLKVVGLKELRTGRHLEVRNLTGPSLTPCLDLHPRPFLLPVRSLTTMFLEQIVGSAGNNDNLIFKLLEGTGGQKSTDISPFSGTPVGRFNHSRTRPFQV